MISYDALKQQHGWKSLSPNHARYPVVMLNS